MADTLEGRAAAERPAILRQQAGRAQSKSRRERQVMRLLMSETFLFFSMQVSGREESLVRNLTSWLLYPLLSSFFPAYVTFLGAWVIVMCAPPETAVSLEISPHKTLFPGHLADTYLSVSCYPSRQRISQSLVRTCLIMFFSKL